MPETNYPGPLTEARPHRVQCNYMLRTAWHVHFVRQQQLVGRYYDLKSPEAVLDLLRRCAATEEEIAEAMRDMKRWGRGSTHVNLTQAQFDKLQKG
jgi:hypothetical protein